MICKSIEEKYCVLCGKEQADKFAQGCSDPLLTRLASFWNHCSCPSRSGKTRPLHPLYFCNSAPPAGLGPAILGLEVRGLVPRARGPVGASQLQVHGNIYLYLKVQPPASPPNIKYP